MKKAIDQSAKPSMLLAVEAVRYLLARRGAVGKRLRVQSAAADFGVPTDHPGAISFVPGDGPSITQRIVRPPRIFRKLGRRPVCIVARTLAEVHVRHPIRSATITPAIRRVKGSWATERPRERPHTQVLRATRGRS